MKLLLIILCLVPTLCFSQIAGKSYRRYDGISRYFQIFMPGDSSTGIHPLWVTGKGSTEANTVNPTPHTWDDFSRNGWSGRLYNDIKAAYTTVVMINIEEAADLNSVQAALVYMKATYPTRIDTTQMAFWGLSLSGGLAGAIAADSAAGGLSRRFAAAVNSCGVQNVSVGDVMSGANRTGLALWVYGATNDGNPYVNFTCPSYQDYLNNPGFSGTPKPKSYYTTTSNYITDHPAGWWIPQDSTPGYRTVWVDSSHFPLTGHGSQHNASIQMRNTGEQVLAYQRVPSGGNIAPTASAGSNQTITLPTSTGALNATGSSDPDGTIVSYAWVKTSGPSTYTITSASSSNTTATGLVQGVYVFTVTVTDNIGATGSASVTITVNAGGTAPTAVLVATPSTTTLPADSTFLTPTGSTGNGGSSIVGWSYTYVSGPAGSFIYAPLSSTTKVYNLVQGTYVFRLTVTDNNGLTGTTTKTVTVNGGGSVPSCTTNSTPVNASTVLGEDNATLVVNAATGATGYKWYYYVNGGSVPGSPAFNNASTTQTIISLTANTTYRWFVTPYNTYGDAVGCSSGSTIFTTSVTGSNYTTTPRRKVNVRRVIKSN